MIDFHGFGKVNQLNFCSKGQSILLLVHSLELNPQIFYESYLVNSWFGLRFGTSLLFGGKARGIF